jgi:hypothetical protein
MILMSMRDETYSKNAKGDSDEMVQQDCRRRGQGSMLFFLPAEDEGLIQWGLGLNPFSLSRRRFQFYFV